MRILHVTKSYLPQSQTFITNTISLLQSNGAQNYLLTVTQDRSIDSFISGHFSVFHRTVTRAINKIGIPYRMMSRLESMMISSRQGEIMSFVEDLKADLIHYHFGWAYESFAGVIGDHGVPVIISFHGSDVSWHSKRTRNYKELILKQGSNSLVRFTCPSEYLKNILVEWGVPTQKIIVLSNTFATKFIKKSSPKTLQKSYLRVLNVARMVPWKGQKYLVEAFAEFLKTNKGHLTLVGSGDEMQRLRELVASLRITEHVRFAKELTHEEVLMEMQKHDVYVQPSIVDQETLQCETFGVVLLEAIASGLVVIATKTGGMPEVLKDTSFENRSYFLVDEKSSPQIAAKLKYICSPEYAPGSIEDYADRKLEEFSNERYITNLKQIYSQIIRK